VRAEIPESVLMMDLVYIALTFGCFALGLGLIKLCDRVT
jgi:hypothetical protein